MKKTVITLLAFIALSAAAPAMAQTTSFSGNCNTAPDARWRTDEPYYDQWGTYNDPYSYGSLAPMGQDLVGTDGYVSYGTTPSYTYTDTSSSGSYYGSQDVDQIAAANLAAATRGGAGYGSATGGVASGTAQAGTTGPSCVLIPRATGSNTVVLEWQTVNASSAFIDNGVGHVALGSGTRMVTPRVTTTYNMTVVDARGFASQCKAIVHVVGGAAPTTNATIVDGSAQDQTQSTTAVATDTTSSSTSTVSDTTTQVSDTATKVSSNVSDKVTSILSTGEGVWSKMRQMSLVAIGLFFIVFIIIFVMRKMFGGGDEGGHH